MMKYDNILKFLIEIADSKIDEINKLGYVEPGVNGPYNCIETPVRNSAHWCVTYAFLFKVTREKKYYEIVEKLANYIYSYQKKSISGAIKCMEDNKFCDTNGLIGQAWAIEGLLYAYNVTNNKKYLNCAKTIFNSQLFDFQIGEWNQIDSNGNNCGFDIAFNHQLWFAAIGLQLNSILNDIKIKKILDTYFEKINLHFNIYRSGLIKHLGYRKNKIPLLNRIKKFLKKIYPTFITRKNPDHLSVYSFESAYQLFNLYGFSIVKKYNPNLNFFSSYKFKKSLNYALNIKKLNKIFNVNPKYRECTCKYAYPYNSPAFEYGFVAETFCKNKYDRRNTLELFNIGIKLCYSNDTKSFNRNTNDSNTLTARIYELVRFLEMIK